MTPVVREVWSFGCVTDPSHSPPSGSALCVFVTHEEAVAAMDMIMDNILLLRENGRCEKKRRINSTFAQVYFETITISSKLPFSSHEWGMRVVGEYEKGFIYCMIIKVVFGYVHCFKILWCHNALLQACCGFSRHLAYRKRRHEVLWPCRYSEVQHHRPNECGWGWSHGWHWINIFKSEGDRISLSWPFMNDFHGWKVMGDGSNYSWEH